jgi:hypothetical protein
MRVGWSSDRPAMHGQTTFVGTQLTLLQFSAQAAARSLLDLCDIHFDTESPFDLPVYRSLCSRRTWHSFLNGP